MKSLLDWNKFSPGKERASVEVSGPQGDARLDAILEGIIGYRIPGDPSATVSLVLNGRLLSKESFESREEGRAWAESQLLGS